MRRGPDLCDVLTSVALLPLRLVLTSLLFSLGLGAQQLSLSGMYGSLCSPNFPEPYPRDTQLRWNISVPDGFRIKLYFSHFDLEPSYLCEYDYVKVRHGMPVFGVCVCARHSDVTNYGSLSAGGG